MEELVLIKLGGSVITDKSKDYRAREKNISRLAKEIRSAFKSTEIKIIVGHGAGSFAHIPAKKYKTKEGMVNKNRPFGMSVTEESAKSLNQLVVKKFIGLGLPVYSFSPGTFLISDNKIYSKSYIDPVKKALEIGIVPIVYGDVVLDKKIGFTIFSTEKILGVLAGELSINYKVRMIYVTDVDGVLDTNGRVIPQVTKSNFESLKVDIGGAKGVDVTGGMLHKVEEALGLSEKIKVKTQIINGLIPGRLKMAILGEKVKGTKVG